METTDKQDFEASIAAAYALSEQLEMQAERLLAESDFWRDRAMILEAEYRQFKESNG